MEGREQDEVSLRRGWRWRPGDRASVWLCAAMAGVFALFAIEAVRSDIGGYGPLPSADFFGIWSYARLVLLHPAARLYDPAWLHQAQVALGMLPGAEMPFPYPPSVLLLVWPLGLLPFRAAYVAWVGGSLCLCLLATCPGARGTAGSVAATLLAPTTAVCVVAGQGGFLLAALLVGGLRLLGRRPVLAGVLFGLLTCKPQFGLLLPLALVAAGRWRCVAAACVTAAALLVADTAVFGWAIWPAWWQSLPAYAALFDRATAENRTIPTVLGNVQALGLSHGVAQAVQAAAALLAGAAVWVAWRRPGPFAAPVLLAATCLATPHAFLYDLPMLSAAAILFAGGRLRATGSLAPAEVAAVAAVLAMPAVVTMLASPVPVSTLTIGFFLGVAVAADRGVTAAGRLAGEAPARPGRVPAGLGTAGVHST